MPINFINGFPFFRPHKINEKLAIGAISVSAETIRKSSDTIATDLEAAAKALRRAANAGDRREVLQALLWHAESIRRLLEIEQANALKEMRKGV